MKSLTGVSVALVGFCAIGAPGPSKVDNVEIVQGADKVVRITYDLENGPAYVLADIQTNVAGDVWASTGLMGLDFATGDANRLVTAAKGEIRWKPWKGMPGYDGNVRVRFTVRPKCDPPDYLVLNLKADVKVPYWYCTDTNSIPGGLLANEEYRRTKMVLKRIHADGESFAMGSSLAELGRTASREATHVVSFTNDYYIGVFEVSQKQFETVYGTAAGAYFKVDGDMRPMEQVGFAQIRGDANRYFYPNEPKNGTFLGNLRARTGLKVDLPGEAQWEFAARAGQPSLFWGNGRVIAYNSTKKYFHEFDDAINGRIYRTGGLTTGGTDGVLAPENVGKATNEWSTANGTAVCGSYEPNLFGLYDTVGNVNEFCNDYLQADISHLTHGEINANGGNYADGTARANGWITRGGAWQQGVSSCRAAARSYYVGGSGQTLNWIGFRIACPVE